MKVPAIALVTLVLAGLILFLITGTGGTAPTPDSHREMTRDARSAEPGGASFPPRGITEEAGQSEAIRTRPFEPPEHPAMGIDGLEVRVRDRDTGTPVPHIVISCVGEKEAGEAAFGGELSLLDIERIVELRGREYRSDEGGVVCVPWPEDRMILWAQTRELFGLEMVEPDATGPVEMLLSAATTGRIRVVDGAGPVAEVPVALLVDMEPGNPMGSMVLWRGRTQGREGIATLHNLEGLLRMLRGGTPRRIQGRDLVVTLGLPSVSRPEVRLEGTEFPQEPVTLTLPPTGRLVVDVTSPRDREMEVRVTRLHRAGNPIRLSLALLDPALQSVWVKGEPALFPWVGVDMELEIELRDPAGMLVPEVRHVAGPRAIGEEVIVDIAAIRRRAALVGRVLDDGGAPLAGCRLRLLTWPGEVSGVSPMGPLITTDREGRFGLPLDPTFALQRKASRIIVSDRPTRHSDRLTPARQGAIQIVGPFPPGDTDIGEVVLRPLPLLLSGRVVDEAGRSLTGVEVAVEFIPEALVASADLRAAARETRASSRESDLVTATDAEGRFAVHAPVVQGPVTVTFMKRGYRGSRESLRLTRKAKSGATDLEVVLTRAGALQGTVLLDPGFSPTAVEASIAGQARSRCLDEDGTFTLDDVWPESAELTIRLARSREVLARIPGLRVKAAEINRDRRIQGIDLRGRLSGFEVMVVDEEGAPIRDARISSSDDPGTIARLSVRTDRSGRARIISTSPLLHVVVSKAGFPESRGILTPGDNCIALRPGIQVEFVLAPGCAVPQSAVLLLPSLLSEQGALEASAWTDDFGKTSASFSYADGWRVCLPVARPGTYRLLLTLWRGWNAATGPPECADITGFQPERIVVPEGSRAIVVEVQVPQRALDEALELMQ